MTEFATICDIPYRSVQNYMRGERALGTDAVIKICTRMSISTSWLLLGEGEMDKILQSGQEPQKPEEIDKVMQELNPEQRQEILTRSMEMKKMNELEVETKKMAKETKSLRRCIEDLEERLEGKL